MVTEYLLIFSFVCFAFVFFNYSAERKKKLKEAAEKFKEQERIKRQKEEKEEERLKETVKVLSQIKKIFSSYDRKISIEFDKDKNNIVDVIEVKDDFNQLLKKHNDIIIERGKEYNQNYIHQFVKVSNYLKRKRENINLIFNNIQTEFSTDEGYTTRNLSLIVLRDFEKKYTYPFTKRFDDLNTQCESYVELLRGEIHSYNLLLFNALNLVSSSVENDQITFYNIYEKLDALNIFNSNWQNEMSQKLTNINNNFQELSKEIKVMGEEIVGAIWDLSYVTEQSNEILEAQLGEINSSIKTNNLLTSINTYQSYKVNKNTKSLR
jgi:hypothetical protein